MKDSERSILAHQVTYSLNLSKWLAEQAQSYEIWTLVGMVRSFFCSCSWRCFRITIFLSSPQPEEELQTPPASIKRKIPSITNRNNLRLNLRASLKKLKRKLLDHNRTVAPQGQQDCYGHQVVITLRHPVHGYKFQSGLIWTRVYHKSLLSE